MHQEGAVKRIPVSRSVWEELGSIKKAGETYDQLLEKMLKILNRYELAEKARKASG